MSTQSTGPRTEAGKERSSMNATKHGILSEKPVIPGEDPAEWERFCDGIVGHYKPVGLYEIELAERAALLMWRMRRVGRMEAAAIADEDNASQCDAAERDGRRPSRTSALDRVIRYEAHLSRQLKQAETMLRTAQAERRQRMETLRQERKNAVESSFRTPAAAVPARPTPPVPARVNAMPILGSGVEFSDLAIGGSGDGKRPQPGK